VSSQTVFRLKIILLRYDFVITELAMGARFHIRYDTTFINYICGRNINYFSETCLIKKQLLILSVSRLKCFCAFTFEFDKMLPA